MNKSAFTYILEISNGPAELRVLVSQMTELGYKTVGSAFRRGSDPRLLQAFVKYCPEKALAA